MDMNVRGPGRDSLGRGLGHRPGRHRHDSTVTGPRLPFKQTCTMPSMLPATTDNPP